MNSIEIKTLLLRVSELSKSNWIHAMHLISEAAEKHPEVAQFHIRLAELYVSRYQYDKAIGSYIKSLATDPSNPATLSAIGNCYMANSEHRLALAYFKKIPTPSDEIIYNMALAQAFLGRHQESIDSIKTILTRLDQHPFLYFIIVEQYYRLGMLEEAIYYLELAKSKTGSHSQLFLLAGIVYARKGLWLKSYHSFHSADQLTTISNSDHLLSYAHTALRVGMVDRATDILNRSLRLNPYISETYVELVKIYLDRDDVNAARKVMLLAKQAIPKLSPVLRLLQERLRSEN